MRPDSQRSTKTHDDDARRAVQPRADRDQSSQRNYDEPTRLRTMVCPGKPNIKDEVRRQNDRQTMGADGQADRLVDDKDTVLLWRWQKLYTRRVTNRLGE